MRQIAGRELDKEKIRYYIMQDFLYLKDYAAGNVHLIDIFVTCSRYEADFWQMAWEQKQ
ncbi:hypothetical protein [Lactobacillus delbrueckii]|nr:hypothetical protein [Lactobacillus delbrueckii]MDA3784455.1 hypothetical protein [Lactobacillus delbrueckii]